MTLTNKAYIMENSSPKLTQYHGKHLLGVDYGEKVIGLSTYKVGIEPFPLLHGRIITEQSKNIYTDLLQIIEDEFIDIIIWGVPYFTDGTESEMTKKVRSIGEELQAQLPDAVHLFFQDETLSTFEAEERMKNDPRFNFQVDLKKIDALSASIIIESFLQD